MEKIKKGEKMFAIIEEDDCLGNQYLWKKRDGAVAQAKELVLDSLLEEDGSDHAFVVEMLVKKITRVSTNEIVEKDVETMSVEEDC